MYAHPGLVVAVSDGAVWIQELLDAHVPTSLRILDLMHAVEYLAAAAQVAFGPGTEQASEWIVTQRMALRHGSATTVLDALAALPASAPRDTARSYLGSRLAILDYPRCDAHQWPVGSGTVESANKLVVEARLKRSGMHWARIHVTPMLALRTLRANGRWASGWPRIVRTWREAVARVASAHRATRRARTTTPSPVPPVPPPPGIPELVPARTARAKTIIDGKPTPDHPWNRGRPRPTPHPTDPQ